MEVRDYRRKLVNISKADIISDKELYSTTSNTKIDQYDLHYILLQPSMQTLLADLNSITNDGHFIWTQEDKYALESQLLLATSQPLCLNPSPVVSLIKNKILSHKFKLNDRHLKRLTNRCSQIYLNRSSKWAEFRLPFPFQILKIRKKFPSALNELHLQKLISINSKQLATDNSNKAQLAVLNPKTNSSFFNSSSSLKVILFYFFIRFASVLG